MRYRRKKIYSHLLEIIIVLVIFAFVSLTNAVSTNSVDKEVTAGIASVLNGDEVVTLLDLMTP